MLKQLLAPQLVCIYVFAASAIYVHFRGRQRLRIGRQLGDHSTFLAPYNVLMYAGSAVPNEPVVSVDRFPELAKLRDNWETIIVIRRLAALSLGIGNPQFGKMPNPGRWRGMRLARRIGFHVR